jgi:hypothetical protein
MQLRTERWPNGRARPKALPGTIRTTASRNAGSIPHSAHERGEEPAVLKATQPAGVLFQIDHLVEWMKAAQQIAQPEKAAEKVIRIAQKYFNTVLHPEWLAPAQSSHAVASRALALILASSWSHFSADFSQTTPSFGDGSERQIQHLAESLDLAHWEWALDDGNRLTIRGEEVTLVQQNRTWPIDARLVRDLLDGVDVQTGVAMLKTCLLAQARVNSVALNLATLAQIVLLLLVLQRDRCLALRVKK